MERIVGCWWAADEFCCVFFSGSWVGRVESPIHGLFLQEFGVVLSAILWLVYGGRGRWGSPLLVRTPSGFVPESRAVLPFRHGLIGLRATNMLGGISKLIVVYLTRGVEWAWRSHSAIAVTVIDVVHMPIGIDFIYTMVLGWYYIYKNGDNCQISLWWVRYNRRFTRRYGRA